MLTDYYLSRVGLEAINFQAYSKLGADLTKCFQRGIDFRRSIKISDIAGYNQQRSFIARKVVDFVNRSIVPEMIKIFKQDAGFVITEAITDTYGGPSGLFAILYIFGDDQTTWVSESQAMGSTIDHADYDIKDKDRKEIIEATKALDKNTGTMTAITFGKDKKKISATLWFDPYVFMYTDYFPNITEDFTAEEIAAIYLHECGHAIGCAERLASIYAWRSRIDQYQVNIKNIKTVKDAKQAVNRAVTVASDVIGTVKKNKSNLHPNCDKLINGVSSALRGISGAVNALPDEEQYDTPSPIFTVLQVTLQMFVVLIKLLEAIPSFVVTMILYFPTLDAIERLMYDSYFTGNIRKTGEKSSDYTTTNMNTRLNERMADEFVARQGYGPQLVSGLNKLYQFFTAASGTPNFFGLTVDNPALRSSALYSSLCQFLGQLLHGLSPYAWTLSFVYEDEYSRSYRVLQDVRAVFKNNDLSGQLADKWISQAMQLEKLINDSKQMRDYQPFKFMISIFNRFMTPAGIIELFKDGNMRRDVEMLQNKLDEMSRNALFYQATRLSRMYS